MILLAITIGYMIIQNLTAISMAAVFDAAGGGRPAGRLGVADRRPRHRDRLGAADPAGLRHRERDGDRHRLCDLRPDPGEPDGRADREVPDQSPQPDPGAGSRPRTWWSQRQQEKQGIGALDFLDADPRDPHQRHLRDPAERGRWPALGLQLPLFVTCLFAGILLTNLMPGQLPADQRPALAEPDAGHGPDRRDVARHLPGDVADEHAALDPDRPGRSPLLTILTVQFLVAVAINIFVVFPVMGRNYDAAVVCAGFGGISLGSTPTAMANMSAVTKRYGASHLAFIVVPLVCAFFIDLANAILIPFFLANF